VAIPWDCFAALAMTVNNMKNYSSNRAQKGKTAYRTPSLFKANKSVFYADAKSRVNDEKWRKKNPKAT
jgi:hypothetical protein